MSQSKLEPHSAVAETALQWDREPNNTTEVLEGRNVTLRWDYNLDGSTLRVVEWTARTTGQRIGEIRPSASPLVFPSFRARFKISETETEATLTIINVTESDTGEYSCRVQTQDLQQIISAVRLDVLRKYRYLSDRGVVVNLYHTAFLYHTFMALRRSLGVTRTDTRELLI